MTSQIIIMNQQAIAVASDTMTSRGNSLGDTKTYPSSSKVMELGYLHDVVVMHCGTTMLAGVNWRLYIREWSMTLDEPLPTMAAYVQSYLEWVSNHAAVLKLDNIEFVTNQIWFELTRFRVGMADALDPVREKLLASKDLDEFSSSVIAMFEQAAAIAFDVDPYPDLTAARSKDLFKKTGIDAAAALRELFDLPQETVFPSALKIAFEKFCIVTLRHHSHSADGMELNFIGFGGDEMLGQIHTVTINGFWGGATRCRVEVMGSDDPSWYPAYKTVAQNRAIQPFLRGIGGDDLEHVASFMRSAVGEAVSPSDEEMRKINDHFLDQVNEYCTTIYTNPTLNTIGAIGISSLGKFADLLIHIEALRSATLEGEATVGGFVESLTITRDQGVIWRHRISKDHHSLEESSHVFE